jgi:hypothetical protein
MFVIITKGFWMALVLVYTRIAAGLHGVAQVLSLASLRFLLVHIYHSVRVLQRSVFDQRSSVA